MLGIPLALFTGVTAPGQSGQHRPRTAQPAQGPPPDQAVRPDVSTELPQGQVEQFPDPPPEQPPAPEAAPAPAPPTPAEPAPAEAAVPPAPLKPASTAEGRRLQSETATLLTLTQEFKAELAKAGTNTLSLTALRKLDAIERLTKTMRQEMDAGGVR